MPTFLNPKYGFFSYKTKIKKIITSKEILLQSLAIYTLEYFENVL